MHPNSFYILFISVLTCITKLTLMYITTYVMFLKSQILKFSGLVH